MSANGKRDHFTREDLIVIGESISLPKPEEIIDEVVNAVEQWPAFANTAGVRADISAEIKSYQRILK
jgi:serine/threonine-protein kinase HipA